MQVRGPPAFRSQERKAYAEKRKETEPDDGSRKTKSRWDLLSSFLTKYKEAKIEKQRFRFLRIR